MSDSNNGGKHHLNAEGWVDNYADMLFAFTVVRVKDEGTAQDIVQDTFLSAWRAREGYKGEASEKNWLFTILRNKITDHYRKLSRSNVDLGLEDEMQDTFSENGHWQGSAAKQITDWKSETASKRVESKEFATILAKCREKLKEVQNAVFTMKYMDDLDSSQICKVLGITPSNYWVLMHRAKLNLRNCIQKNWIDK